MPTLAENKEVQTNELEHRYERTEDEEEDDEYEPRRLERVMSVLTTLGSLNLKSLQASNQPLPTMKDSPDPEILFSMYSAAIRPSYMRSFFATKGGHIGMGPAYSKAGDRVCLIMGLNAPYIVRTTEDRNPSRVELIGEAYVHGMMDGEMMKVGEAKDIYLV